MASETAAGVNMPSQRRGPGASLRNVVKQVRRHMMEEMDHACSATGGCCWLWLQWRISFSVAPTLGSVVFLGMRRLPDPDFLD